MRCQGKAPRKCGLTFPKFKANDCTRLRPIFKRNPVKFRRKKGLNFLTKEVDRKLIKYYNKFVQTVAENNSFIKGRI